MHGLFKTIQSYLLALTPATGLMGVGAAEAARNAGTEVWDGVLVVAVVWLLIAICAVGVIKPYLAARRLRAERATNDAPQE